MTGCAGACRWRCGTRHDHILKERLFGLTNAQGNHGEDVKELYYFLDGTPTHSYMRMLYKYPQAAFPYDDLLATNARARGEGSGIRAGRYRRIFAERRYFDVEIEYAKASTDDILMRITVHNRGPEQAPIHVLPHLWAHNDWSFQPGTAKAQLTFVHGPGECLCTPGWRGMRICEVDAPEAEWLFCENETNFNRLYGAKLPGPFKDGINDYVVDGKRGAISALRRGSKCAAHMRYDNPGRWPGAVAACGCGPTRRRTRSPGSTPLWIAAGPTPTPFTKCCNADMPDPDARHVQRQALAGMLWSKQYYGLDIRRWLDGDPGQPTPPPERKIRPRFRLAPPRQRRRHQHAG